MKLRFALVALAFGLLFATEADAKFRSGSVGTGAGGAVTITGVTLSANWFNSNTANATVGMLTATTTGGSFTGTIVLGTGSCTSTDNASFTASGTTLAANGGVLPNAGSGTGGVYQVCAVATMPGATGSPYAQNLTITSVEAPGPSAALFAHPYYSCTRNYYVNGSTGNNSYDGTSPTYVSGTTGPWLTIANADTSSRTGGDCINVAPGTYANANEYLGYGGTTATSTGYVVYRCATLLGCTIQDGYKTWCMGANCARSGGDAYPNYLIFDGFAYSPTTVNQTNASAITCDIGGSSSTISLGCHHIWIINSTINGYGQSGVQLNSSEFYYAVHNTITQSSHDCSGAQGSGISFGFLKYVSGYTKTADDQSNPRMSIYGTSNPYDDVIAWNSISNSYIGCTSGNSDGNGIIRDENGNPATYQHQSLVAFNVVYNNGGNGVHFFVGQYATAANNSVFNNALDPYNSGTAKLQLDENDTCSGCQNAHNMFLNNIAYAIPGSGVAAYINTYLGNSATVTFTGNLSYCATAPTGGCNAMYNGASFSCSTNKCNQVPSWVNVGNTSVGTESTQPNGVNFALSGGSAAIGEGTTESWLSPQAVDAGACSHLLLTCP